MSKELTPLEALEEIIQYNDLKNPVRGQTKLINIIETALKEYETLKEYYKVVVSNREFDKEYFYKCVKALEIIKETPIFAWYITIYKDAYEMVSDVKGFRVNNSVEELQQMFDLLKEVLL